MAEAKRSAFRGWVVGTALAVVFVGAVIPALGRARDRSRRLVREARIKGIMAGLSNYAAANRGAYPAAGMNLFAALPPVGVPWSAMIDDQNRPLVLYAGGATWQSPPTTVVAVEAAPDRRGGVIGYADGRAEWLGWSRYEAAARSAGLTPPARPE